MFKHSWLITRIGKTESFIEFLLLKAPQGSTWLLGDDSALETLDKLSKNDLDRHELDLTEANRKKLIDLLPDLNIKKNVIAHSIQSPEGSTFFKSYDQLTCVWLSKEIPEENMDSFAMKYDFDYRDYDDGNKSKS